MEINTVSIVGLGALGLLFGNLLSQKMPEGALRVIADPARIERYTRDGVYVNGTPCRFHYVTPDEKCTPADLLLVAVKYNELDAAIAAATGHVGPNTLILSLLNGISSEERIGRTFGDDKVLLCVAQGMDAVREGNRLMYRSTGLLSFGDPAPGDPSEKVRRIERFFIKNGIPHEVVAEMKRRQWSKFMLNVGANQVTAVYRCDYAGVQENGPYRQLMIDAMREVVTLSEAEGVFLNDADVVYWLNILDSLNPRGKTSMQQDAEARRKSEADMLAGTVLALGEKHGMRFPVNQLLYDRILEVEREY